MTYKKICKCCKTEKEDTEFKDYLENCLNCSDKINESIRLLGGFTNENNAYIVDNYPYGFLRTKIKYWIETTKQGDRFVSQTLNPKSNKWNNPKKSIYNRVMVMTIDFRGYINYIGLYGGHSLERHNRFIERTKGFSFSEAQKEQIKRDFALNKAMENVTFEVKAKRFKNLITGEIGMSINIFDLKNCVEVDQNDNIINQEETKQEEAKTMSNINKAIAYEYSKI